MASLWVCPREHHTLRSVHNAAGVISWRSVLAGSRSHQCFSSLRNVSLTLASDRYWQLPRNAELHLTLKGMAGPRRTVTLGEACFRLFSKKGHLKSGRKKALVKLYTKPGGQEDGVAEKNSAVPETVPSMEKLEKLIQRYDRNALDHSP